MGYHEPGEHSGHCGAATDDLTFQWVNTFNLATTSSVKLTVTDNNGHQEIQTYTFALPAGETGPGGSGGSGGVTWPETLAPDVLRPESPVFDSHNATVDAGTGALDTNIALPSYNPPSRP